MLTSNLICKGACQNLSNLLRLLSLLYIFIIQKFVSTLVYFRKYTLRVTKEDVMHR